MVGFRVLCGEQAYPLDATSSSTKERIMITKELLIQARDALQ